MTKTKHLSEQLKSHQRRLIELGVPTLFEQDPQRFDQFSVESDGLLLDFSKNFIDSSSFAHLIELANNAGLKDKINAMFDGSPINNTEQRKVLHTALRADPKTIPEDISELIVSAKQKIYALADRLRDGSLKGYSGKTITTIVNIGVGGSDLGPYMAVEALSAYYQSDTRFEFVSNIDPVHISRCLATCDPETTLFLICSKTFTTLETLSNANAARQWFLATAGDEAAIAHHFHAVSTNLEAAAQFGIPEQNLYPMWDWVGGRYSLWSAIGLVIALAIGKENFEAFLAGGRSMDEHFKSAEYSCNLPIIMGLLGIWYGNYFSAQTQALICYDQNLIQFANYLQQLDMESNGKSVHRDGSPVTEQTGPIIWGGVGTNTQHSFHQLIHQGTHLIPVDFIVGIQSTHPCAEQQKDLFSNCLAQSQAMLEGRTKTSLIEEMTEAGKTREEAEFLAKHRFVAGNKPSNTLVYQKLSPFVLGQLIALYEHKVFAQSVIWDINAFDQWGVELGKQLSKTITKAMNDPELTAKLDSSTQGLMKLFLQKQ